ncbi:Formate hydrogenlyase subunit 5 precursor [Pelotomaculum schinkii]|uniref:Formate hydrogenlyase subunit 5 n=1 Tax=Pelotomaculum schinkii TaxID=78350 RepID=A0A4Y7RH57_9FIRM|nr:MULTISPECIES: NADH-quinone oxidoreductase subunit C [Pelotomaculum]TEB08099.1 Formate hydrogenlyase subunit 5 precursor [Pelotomaculum schinkii]TEB15789.1 Formate hydrogenlyase subunit 5 precursor [Pelotomaculum sp. FP]
MVTREELSLKLIERLGKVKLTTSGSGKQLFVVVAEKDLSTSVDYVFNQLGARLITTVGTDRTPVTGKYEVSYIFSFDRDNLLLVIKVEVDPANPVIESVTPIIPGADWAEREVRDLIGVQPENHPDPRRLVLSDDWPEEVYPMRQDFPFDYQPPKVENARPQLKEKPENTSVMTVGPFFPTLEEPAYFRLFVEGERIVGSDYRGFYSHRGIEKLADKVLDYNRVPFLAERICGICGFVHSCCYCQAVEAAAEIEAPARAKYIRTIMLELERIHSHLLWLGLAGHIIGFDTVLMQSWRIRERLMWLTEQITGNRKTYGMNLVGGVRRDITVDLQQKIKEVLAKIEAESRQVVDAISGDTTLLMRLQNVGCLSAEDARLICVVGPTARASGVDIDSRRDHPYAAYPDLQLTVPVYKNGDSWDRTLVRLDELFVSIDLVRQALEKMPDGPIMAEDPVVPPGREGVSVVEAPRGECCHYVITGTDRPERWRVRASTYPQLQAVPVMFNNQTVADAPIIIGSIDPCFSCTERLETVDVKSRRLKVYTKAELMEACQSGRLDGDSRA